MAFLTEYGLFLAKTLTLLLAIGAVVLMVVSSRQPRARKGELVVTDLSRELEQGRHQLQSALAGKAERKQMDKARKADSTSDGSPVCRTCIRRARSRSRLPTTSTPACWCATGRARTAPGLPPCSSKNA